MRLKKIVRCSKCGYIHRKHECVVLTKLEFKWIKWAKRYGLCKWRKGVHEK